MIVDISIIVVLVLSLLSILVISYRFKSINDPTLKIIKVWQIIIFLYYFLYYLYVLINIEVLGYLVRSGVISRMGMTILFLSVILENFLLRDRKCRQN